MAKDEIRIVEVGARDGLQNEKSAVSVWTRIELIKRLVKAGLPHVEMGSFVSPKWVPQMDGSFEISQRVLKWAAKNSPRSGLELSCLVPNQQGMEDAVIAKVPVVAVFAASTEGFSKKNLNCTIEESFKRFEPVMEIARKNKIKVRGYLSTVFYCPYEGKTDPKKVVPLVEKLFKMGCYEVSLGDTLGAAVPTDVENILKLLKTKTDLKKIAMHLHDTRGTALANILKSLDLGIRTFDASIGGLGGCPYAPGSSGNVATEDVVYMLENMGLKTGIDLKELIKINQWMSTKLERELRSRVSKAGLPKGF